MGIQPYVVRQMPGHYYRTTVDFLLYRQTPMFRDVSIEISSFCNRKCKACPVSISPRKEKEYMEEHVYDKILNELGRINFYGRIALHHFNEPLADKNIVAKVRKASTLAPKAAIEIRSNGDYLNNILLRELVDAGLNTLNITAYEERTYSKIEKIASLASDRENKVLKVQRVPQLIGNRAGSLDNTSISKPLIADCFLPSKHMVINYKGEVVICSNDYYGKVVLGNVAQKSLMDIWQSDDFNNIRRILKRKDRSKITTCTHCNFISSPYRWQYLTSSEVEAHNKKNYEHAWKQERRVTADMCE